MDLILKFIGFLATAYLARVLGKSGFGAINVGQSVVFYALILANGGLSLLGTRNIAANRNANEIAGEIFYGRLILSTIVFIIAIVVSFILLGTTENFFIILSYMFFLFPTVFILEWFFIGLQKMEIVAYARITGTAVYLLLIILIVKERDDAVLTGIAWTIGGIVTAIVFTYSFKKNGYTFQHERSKKYFWKTLKKSFPLGIASYISQFLIAFPVIYIAYIAGNSEAGIFSAALKMIGLFLIFDRVFVTLFLPKITNIISTRESSLEEIFNILLKIIVISVLIISIFLFLFSEVIITRTFGNDYGEAIFIFRILLIYFVFTIIDSVFANTLIGLMKEKVYTISLFIALIFFMLMTFILTPYLNEYGVIYSFISINIISLSYMIYILKNEIKIKLTRYILLPLIFSFLFYIMLIMFPLAIYVQVIIMISVFIPLLILITGFNKSDINFIRRIFI